MRRWLSGLLVLASVAVQCAHAKDHLYQDTLRNGLRMVFVEDDRAPLVHLTLLVGVGPAVTADEAASASLLLLRAALRDVKRRIAGPCEIVAGADHVGVRVAVDPGSFEAAAKYLATCLGEPDFTQNDLDQAREKMAREVELCHLDVTAASRRAFLATAYLTQPIRNDSWPTSEQLVSLPLARAQAAHKVRIVPERTVVAVVGDLSIGAGFQALKASFEGWERGDPVPQPLITEAAQTSAREASLVVGDERATLVGWRTVGVSHPDRLALDVLEAVLQSRLGLFAHLESVSLATGTGYASVLSPQPGNVLLAEIDRLRTQGVSQAELGKTTAAFLRSCPEHASDGAVRSSALAMGLLRGGDPEERIKRWQRAERLAPESLLGVANRYLARELLTTVRIEPMVVPGPAQSAERPRGESFSQAPNGVAVGVAAHQEPGVALALYFANVTRDEAAQLLQRCAAKRGVLSAESLGPVAAEQIAAEQIAAEQIDGGVLLTLTGADADLVSLVQTARALIDDPVDVAEGPPTVWMPSSPPLAPLHAAAWRWLAQAERVAAGELVGVGVAGAIVPAPVQEMVSAALGRKPRQQRAAGEIPAPGPIMVLGEEARPKIAALFLFPAGQAPPPAQLDALAAAFCEPIEGASAALICCGARAGLLVQIDTAADKAKADLDGLRARLDLLRDGKIDLAAARFAGRRGAVAKLSQTQDLGAHARCLARRAAREDHDFAGDGPAAVKEAAGRLDLAATFVLWPKDSPTPDDWLPAAHGHQVDGDR